MGRCSGSMVLGALLLISFAGWASSTDYTVGDSSGWALGVSYTNWVTGKTFRVGDTLVFNYSASQHNVEEVSSSDYTACSSSNPISRNNNGPTTIPLSASGKRYFICGITGHCSGGMKLEVDVSAAGSTPSSPPSPPPPPSSSTTPPAPPPPSSSTTPPAPSGATSLSPAQAIAALFVGFLGMKLALF